MNAKGLDRTEVERLRKIRKTLLSEHKVYDDGTLYNYFGKFERQPFYAIYFYDVYLDGGGEDIFDGCPEHEDSCCDCELGPIPLRIDLSPEELYVFPELRTQGDVPVVVRLDESDQGFVYLSLIY